MLEKTIQDDYIAAMKTRNALKSSVLSFLRAQIKNARIAAQKDALSDEEIWAIIRRQIKQREDSVQQYLKGGRQDLADKEKAEAEILKAYLPQEIDDAQLDTVIDEVIQETGAQGPKAMGAVMKGVLARVAGRADSKRVSDRVRQKLIG